MDLEWLREIEIRSACLKRSLEFLIGANNQDVWIEIVLREMLGEITKIEEALGWLSKEHGMDQ